MLNHSCAILQLLSNHFDFFSLNANKAMIAKKSLMILIVSIIYSAEVQAQTNVILNKINEEIETLKEEIKNYEKYEQSITAIIDKLQLEIKLKEKEIKAYNLQINILEQEIKEIENNISELEKNIKISEDYIKRRLIVAYKMGSLGYYKMLLYPKDYSTIVRAYQLINILSKKDQSLISNYQLQKQQLNMQQSELHKKQEEIRINKEKIEKAKAVLAIKVNDQKILLYGIKEQKEIYLRAINELQVSAKKLEFLIKDIKSKEEYLNYLPSIKAFRGILNWPLMGTIIKKFGKEKHEKFNTYIFNKGIEIKAQEGENVRAVFEGKVVFAEWFQGYGKLIIIEHKDNIYTLYAHNSKILVKVNDIVHTGQIIALAGSTGSLVGNALYFEIRDGIEPQDPLLWLKKR